MILVADSDRGFRARVAEQLGMNGQLGTAENLPQLERLLAERSSQATVVLLGPNVPSNEALALAGKLQMSRPDVSVLFVSGSLTSEVLQAALRAGVRDVLPTSFTPQQLNEAVQRAEKLCRQFRDGGNGGQAEPEVGADHKIFTVFSSKGGSGKSFVASNLAVLLSQKTGEEVALVDLDLQFGDLAIMLQVFPSKTIYDAAQALERLDAGAIRGYLTPYAQVSLLPAPLEPGLSETISAEASHRIVQLLRQSFKYVVIDTPPAFTDHVLAALDESAEVVLITTMDVPSIKNLKLSLQTLELLGIARDRIKLVLNRADSKVGLHILEVEKTLRTNVDIAIPSSREVPLSINRGVPLVTEDPKSPVAASIGKLVGAVVEAGAPNGPGGRLRLRRR